MTRVHIEIIHKESADIDIGDLPIRMIQKLLKEGDGSFGGSDYSLGDLQGKDKWEVQSIEVSECPT